MGAIMLDFQWNSMRASQSWWLGYADDLLFAAMDDNPYHFVLGSMYGSILYNPANSTGLHTREDTVYVYSKNK